jgi:hypothetical protein
MALVVAAGVPAFKLTTHTPVFGVRHHSHPRIWLDYPRTMPQRLPTPTAYHPWLLLHCQQPCQAPQALLLPNKPNYVCIE